MQVVLQSQGAGLGVQLPGFLFQAGTPLNVHQQESPVQELFAVRFQMKEDPDSYRVQLSGLPSRYPGVQCCNAVNSKEELCTSQLPATWKS